MLNNVFFCFFFFEKPCRLRDNVKTKCDRAGQATYDSI